MSAAAKEAKLKETCFWCNRAWKPGHRCWLKAKAVK